MMVVIAVKAGQKGLRKLRGLRSTVNYDGTYSQNRGSSTGGSW